MAKVTPDGMLSDMPAFNEVVLVIVQVELLLVHVPPSSPQVNEFSTTGLLSAFAVEVGTGKVVADSSSNKARAIMIENNLVLLINLTSSRRRTCASDYYTGNTVLNFDISCLGFEWGFDGKKSIRTRHQNYLHNYPTFKERDHEYTKLNTENNLQL